MKIRKICLLATLVFLLSFSLFLYDNFVSSSYTEGSYIYSGWFNSEEINLDPIILADSSVLPYESGNSGYSAVFKNNLGEVVYEYFIPENSISTTVSGKSFFYFITSFPEETKTLSFEQNGSEIYLISFTSTIPFIEKFNVFVNDINNSIDISWEASDGDTSVYCNRADITRDGAVRDGDLAVFLGNFGRNDCSSFNSYCNRADITRDGKSSDSDLGVLLNNFGRNDCLNSIQNWCNGADVNRDGAVDPGDGDDLMFWRMFEGNPCSLSNSLCNNNVDINQDGIVNDIDENLMMAEFGRTDCSEPKESKLFSSLYYKINDSEWVPILFEAETSKGDFIIDSANLPSETLSFKLVVSDYTHQVEEIIDEV